jgi:hypothetical protein
MFLLFLRDGGMMKAVNESRESPGKLFFFFGGRGTELAEGK